MWAQRHHREMALDGIGSHEAMASGSPACRRVRLPGCPPPREVLECLTVADVFGGPRLRPVLLRAVGVGAPVLARESDALADLGGAERRPSGRL